MTLVDRIIKYILKRETTTLMQLEGVVVSNGFTLDELFIALETVHKDKRIQYTANASGEITYRPARARVSSTPTHVEWLRDNYPYPDNFILPFPEIDMSYMFLKTHDERMEYKAQAKGVPRYMLQSGGERKRRTA